MKTQTRLDALCSAIIDCPHSTPIWTQSGKIVLRSFNIRSGRLNLAEQSFTDEIHYKERTRRAKPEFMDLVITREAPMGEVAMIPEGLECCLGQRMVLLRPDQSLVNPRFLLYALQGPQVQFQIGWSEGTGSTVSNLRIPDLCALNIPLLPRANQDAIAQILGSLDDKIELNRRMNEALEEMARTIFRSWFVNFDPVRIKARGGDPVKELGISPEIAALFPNSFEDSELGEIPKEWISSTASSLIEVNPKRTLKQGTLAPYIEMKSLPTRGHAITDVVNRPASSGSRFTNFDTLVARITPCLENGKTAYIDVLEPGQIGWGSTEFIVLRSREGIPSEFSYFLARDPLFRDHLEVHMTGSSGRQRVPNDIPGLFQMVKSPPQIYQAFSDLVRPIFSLMTSNSKESQILRQTRDLLLPKLLSGEVQIG